MFVTNGVVGTFFFNDTATTEIYTLSLHDALPISALAPVLRAETPVVACAKGIERGTHRFMTEIIDECIPGAVAAILSGPSFASDVARGLPTAVTLAARDEAVAQG